MTKYAADQLFIWEISRADGGIAYTAVHGALSNKVLTVL